VNEVRSRLATVTAREVLLLLISVSAAWLFFNHELFYFSGAWSPRAVPAEAYVVLTLILFTYFHGAMLVLSLRTLRVRRGLVLCPECGQELSDGTPEALEAHRRTSLTPRPTEKEILAAVALRKAIDDARVGAAWRRGDRPASIPRMLGEIENRPPEPDPLQMPPSVSVTPTIIRRPKEPKGPA